MTGFKSAVFAGLALMLMSACSTRQPQTTQTGKADKPAAFSLDKLVKTDVDMVIEIQVELLFTHLRTLMHKLYLRNPAFWKQAGFQSIDAAVAWAFDQPENIVSQQLRGKRSIESIRLGFDGSFSGDRVLALVFGLKTMLLDAYDNKTEFYFLDQLDPQKVYNSARNIEVAVWMLSNEKKADGSALIISNELQGQPVNLSFERLFGKMIAIQDSTARFIADTTNRQIKNVIQGVAGFVFLPI